MVRLDQLQGRDFEDYLTRLYLTMIRLGAPTRAHLVHEGYDEDDIPRATRILEGRELIDAIGPDAWEVRPPESALPLLAADLEARARFTRANAAELGAIWRQSRQDAAGERVRGLEMLASVEGIVLAATALEGMATAELRGLYDGSPASMRLLLDTSTLQSPAPERPRRRSVIDIAALDDEAVIEAIEVRIAAGDQVRVADGLPFSGIVADDRAVLLDLSRHDGSGDGSFVARRAAAVRAMIALFEVAFEMSTPMATALSVLSDPDGSGVPLEPRDAKVLGLLAIGASDQMIARQLDVSTRTVERRVRYLMEHLGASTRFQAGVQAARRGWI